MYKAETLRKMEIKVNSPDFVYDSKHCLNKFKLIHLKGMSHL